MDPIGGIYGGIFGGKPDDRAAGTYGGDPNYRQDQLAYLGQQKQQAYGQADTARNRQDQVGASYLQAMNGQGPSVAEQQMLRGNQQAAQQGLSMAANAGGHNALLANQQAAAANAQAAGQAGFDAAQLRAQEIAQAREGAAGLFGQMRGQSLQQGQFNEQTAQGMNQAILGADTQMQAANLQKDVDYQKTRATSIGGLITGLGGAGAMASAGAAGCCSPWTLIDTPAGERRVDTLKVGDPVWSERDGERVESTVEAVTTKRWDRGTHHVIRVWLENHRVMEITGTHPTADGRTFDDLAPGDMLGGQLVRAVQRIPYKMEHTHDVRPATKSGCYWAEGALIGSTIPAGE